MTTSSDSRLAARSLAASLGRPLESVALVGSGTDHVVFAVGDDLVARFVGTGTGNVAAALTREARLLDRIAGRLPVPVPRVVEVDANRGLLVTTRVAGESLLGRADVPVAIIDAIADVVVAVHAVPTDLLADVVDEDPYPLTDFAAEAIDNLNTVGSRLDPATRRALASALTELPGDPTATVFVHNDFGAEHILMGADGGLTGVIDWSDAAFADPARDLARVLRDFGPAAYRRVLRRYPHRWDERDEARTWFLARCAALEDLAFGVSEQRNVYVDAAILALRRLAA